jgi:hypothetical protein
VDLTPFVLNVSGRLSRMEEYVMRAQNWRNFAPCASFAYEYHFWKHQYFAPGVLSFARRIYEDIISYKQNGFDGIIEDGSQRSFFPNGLCYWVYAQTLFDNSVSYDALIEDYFSHAYGESWKEIYEIFEQIDARLAQKYLEVPHSLKYDKAHYHKAEMVKPLQEVAQICDRLDALLAKQENMPMRAQTVSVRLLEKYSEFCRGLAATFALKAQKKDLEASDFFKQFAVRFGAYEVEIERYFDHKMFYNTYRPLLKEVAVLEQ